MTYIRLRKGGKRGGGEYKERGKRVKKKSP